MKTAIAEGAVLSGGCMPAAPEIARAYEIGEAPDPSHDDYHMGFREAAEGDPLFSDASPQYAHGWRACHSLKEFLRASDPQNTAPAQENHEVASAGIGNSPTIRRLMAAIDAEQNRRVKDGLRGFDAMPKAYLIGEADYRSFCAEMQAAYGNRGGNVWRFNPHGSVGDLPAYVLLMCVPVQMSADGQERFL